MENKEKFDSTADTLQHILDVQSVLNEFTGRIQWRALHHDHSKLMAPEKATFDAFTPLLKETAYGSSEYKSILLRMAPAIAHHVANNSHHPEYFKNGVVDMTLIDLIEMLADWRASGRRNKNGNIKQSLSINRVRFNIPDGIFKVLENTAVSLGWYDDFQEED